MGFTKLGERITPSQLLSTVHELFWAFDSIAADLHVLKIESVGDAYVCCTCAEGGGADADGDASSAKAGEGEEDAWREGADRLARMALAMQAFCAGLEAPDGSPLVMRVGVHSAPAIGGVAGTAPLRYHLFGSLVRE